MRAISFLFSILIINSYGSTSIEPIKNGIILSINEKVEKKKPGLQIPIDWQARVFIKYYPEEASIKVHCNTEDDAPFARVLIRNLFRVYKQNFPSDKCINKIKLSFQQPTGLFISAEELSKKGYLSALNELVNSLPLIGPKIDISSSITSLSPNFKASVSSLTSISDVNVPSFPIYIFFSNDEEKLRQESMVHLLAQLGFNVIHIFGIPPCVVEPSSCSLKVPNLLSPSLENNVTDSVLFNVSNKSLSKGLGAAEASYLD
ncbi:hypothetical protein HWI79_2235 [Cryptosporidium felis]|nr:hypothetical protein HWI79_2235 [Cryptosporidium felis]